MQEKQRRLDEIKLEQQRAEQQKLREIKQKEKEATNRLHEFELQKQAQIQKKHKEAIVCILCQNSGFLGFEKQNKCIVTNICDMFCEEKIGKNTKN